MSTGPNPTSEVRQVIGRWRVGSVVGSGGQATVYRAWEQDVEGGRAVAIKLLTEPSDNTRWKRFQREMEIHASLADSEHILPIIETGVDGGTAFIVMPLAETSLQRAAAHLTGRLELCMEVFGSLVLGLSRAHAAGVTHRDVKPANALCLEKGLRRVCVSDFGICHLRSTLPEDRLTSVGETVGAKMFMAPECECPSGLPDVTPRADVYSLGKVLHFMITRRYLYREELSDAFTQAELQEDPRLSSVLRELIEPCVRRNPADRLPDAGVLTPRVNEFVKRLRAVG